MPFPPGAVDWMSRAEIDYIGPFVKAWAAFNAWYRHSSGESRERQMLEYVKHTPNAVRRNVLPLLDNDNSTADALKLKQAICDLQQGLDSIHFEVVRNEVKERISLRSVCISQRPLQGRQYTSYRQEYRLTRVKGGAIEIVVKSLQTGLVKFQHRQPQYDPEAIYTLPSFTEKLTEAQRTTLRQFYDECNPRPMRNLVQGEEPALAIGAMQFRCNPEDLLCGLVETVYAMRNALLHGEVEPDAQVLTCYEPAYRIVMQFLACVR